MSQGNTPITAAPESDRAAGPTLYELIRRGRSFSGHEQHCCFLNLGDGTFADISAASGFAFPDDGRAVARVDWDRDGDLDLWVANRNGPQLRILLNELPSRGRFLEFRLEGTASNRDAIGARVEVHCEGVSVPLQRTLRAGDGFLAQSSKWLHFGLGTHTPREVVVHWPSGSRERFGDVQPGGYYRLVEGTGQAEPLTDRPPLRLPSPSMEENQGSSETRVLLSSMLALPEMSYQTSSGDARPLVRHDGQSATVVNLWATWCPPCVAELAEWRKAATSLAAAGVQVVALSVDGVDTRQGSVTEAQKRMQPESPLTFGFADEKTLTQLQLIHDFLFDSHQQLPLPCTFLIDADGQLAAFYRGRVSPETLLSDVQRSQTPLKSRILASTPFPGRWHFHRAQLNPHGLVWQWLQRGWVSEATHYIQQHAAVLREHPSFHNLLVLAGNGVLGAGDAATAIQYYRQALEVAPDDADAHNNLGWLYATHPDDQIRNPALALTHAESARDLSPNRPSVLDTLAAALAANGRMTEAIRVTERAIELAEKTGDTTLVKSLRAQLKQLQK